MSVFTRHIPTPTPPEFVEAVTSFSISPHAVLRFSWRVVDVMVATVFALIRRSTIVNFVSTSKLFQYVSDKNGAIDRLDRVSNKAETRGKLEGVVSLLMTGPMTVRDPIFSDPDFEDLVVLAHIANRIDDHQLGTAFYWKSVLRRYGARSLREVPLFLHDKRVNPEARKIMLETAKSILTDQEIDGWFRHMQDAPPSERQLLVGEMIFDGAPVVSAYRESLFNRDLDSQERLRLYKATFQVKRGAKPTIMDVIYTAGINLFNRVGEHRVFPSMRMANTLFKMKGGHCRLAFRFGLSRTLRENGLQGERDVALRNPYQLISGRADGVAAPLDEYTSHDLCFHAYLLNHIPTEHQRLFIEIGDLFTAESQKPNADPMMWFYADRYYDMECPLYLVESSLMGAFLASLYGSIATAPYRKQIADLQEIYSQTDKSEIEKDRLALLVFDNIEPIDESIALKQIMEYFTSKASLTPLEKMVLEALISYLH